MTRPQVVLVDYDEDLFEITPAVQQAMAEAVSAAGGELVIGQWRSEAGVCEMARDAAVVMIQSVRPLLNATTIPALSRCCGIIRLGLGYDSVDLAAATAAGIPVSNVLGWCNDEVAEHTLALLLAAVRRLAGHDRQMRSGAWERQIAGNTPRLCGETVGLIGFGRVARAVAARLHPFGVRLLVSDPAVSAEEAEAHGATLVSLDQLLATSAIVSVHARLDAGSYHLLGRAAFEAMKPGALLVNTSRGPIVDEAALIEALGSGQLGGAALDVMEQEPLAPDSPLRGFDNVLLTPHIASYSAQAVSQLYCLGAGIAADFLVGRWPATVVNPDVRPLADARRATFR